MPWYKAGTVSVTQNSNAVIGSGTAFIANSRVGDGFRGPDGGWYEVTNIASDTAMSISPNYQGATNGAGGYALAPLQGYVKESADRLRALVLQYGDKLAALGTTGNYDILPLAKGGTGASDVAGALTSIGLKGGSNDLLIKSIGFRGAPVAYNVQGLYMGWNGNGDGGANYICNRGGGLGGHAWWSVNSDNTAAGPVMTYSYSGLLTVNQVSTTVVSTNQINGLTTALTIAQGGTGANSQAGAQNALGLGVAQTPQFAGIELSAAAPYIDWHYANSTADYSVRMQIDSASSMGVSGDWGARAYWCKLGLNGARGSNRFNMNWTGSAMDLYVDASYVGSLSLFTSDYRIKKLIKDVAVPSFLDRIDAYRIVNFQKRIFGAVFRGDGTTYQGLIAHEAQAVNPLAVSGEKDGADADGNPIIQQLEPMALITDLMGAVKELRAELREIQAQLMSVGSS
ncbi:tail fiber domain-containing protein [Pseudomonas caricapapayae]|nr:tail fiber domain-containing protein [Pseudomonas caricapapayae]KAA8689552.1 tail fiber domain-containing protein [Pseudomonas caricapapayae]